MISIYTILFCCSTFPILIQSTNTINNSNNVDHGRTYKEEEQFVTLKKKEVHLLDVNHHQNTGSNSFEQNLKVQSKSNPQLDETKTLSSSLSSFSTKIQQESNQNDNPNNNEWLQQNHQEELKVIPLSSKFEIVSDIHIKNNNNNTDEISKHEFQNDFELQWWPWHHDDDNDTNNNDSNSTDSDPNSDSNNTHYDSCNIHTNCTSCTSSSIFCHWCSFDSKCHSKGSIHGCAWGQSCTIPNDNSNNSKSNKCASHTSCTECSLSSHLCHWCAFDNACHVMGSWYGCTTGVNCFNNDRCKRDTPEPIDYRKEKQKKKENNGEGDGGEEEDDGISFAFVLVLIGIGASIICCCTICFVSVRAVKGAYDDWTLVHYSNLQRNEDDYNDDGHEYHIYDGDDDDEGGRNGYQNGRRSRRRNNRRRGRDRRRYANDSGVGTTISLPNIEEGEEKDDILADNNHIENENEQLQLRKEDDEDLNNDEETGINDDGGVDDDHNNDNSLTEKLLPSSSLSKRDNQDENDDDHDDYDEFHDNNITTDTNNAQPTTRPVSAHPSPSRLPSSSSLSPQRQRRQQQQFGNNVRRTIRSMRYSLSSSVSTSMNNRPSSSKSIICCYYSCLVTYTLSIITVILLISGSIYYFPKVPEFNVCSDEFAWNSIMDSLTSLKMEASFEVLSSIKNTNHLNIVLDNINGSFRHNGEDVGTFSMKTTTIQADSITDVLVTCSVRPDKWEALGLISDYYRNKLEFLINVSGNVKVQGLIGYSFPIAVKDVLVQVNDKQMDDRHLCHCPEWKDLYPTSSPVSVGSGIREQKKISFEEAVVLRRL